MSNQSQGSRGLGCVVGCWTLFCVFLMWVHPFFGIALWVMGCLLIGSLLPKEEPKDTIDDDDWEQPRRVVYRQEEPQHVVYRHEVKVTETIYVSRNFRPRRQELDPYQPDPYKLKGVFRQSGE